MAEFKGIIITNAGLELIAATHSGDTIEFTAIKTGNGVYDGTEVLEELTNLKSVKQTFGITGLTRESAVVKVRSAISKKDVTEGYYITEVGLYAINTAGDEIMYAVFIAEDTKTDYFPPYAESPQSITFEIYITTLGIEEGVTFTASAVEGLYATVQDLEDVRVEVDDLKKSVSDGKILVADAITDKGVTTATNATFATMATNIAAIKTDPTLQAKTATLSTAAQTIKADSGYDGLSQVTVPAITGTAAAENVLAGKTFSSADGVNQTGTMTNRSNTTLAATFGLADGYVRAKIPADGFYSGTNSFLNATYASVASLIGLTAPKIVSGNTILGIAGTGGGKKYGSGTTSDANTVVIPASDRKYYLYTYSYGSESYYGDYQNVAIVNHGLDFTPSMVRITWNYSGSVYRTILSNNTMMGTLIINAPGQGNNCYTISEVINNVHNSITVLMNDSSFYFYAMNFGAVYGNLTSATWEAWE